MRAERTRHDGWNESIQPNFASKLPLVHFSRKAVCSSAEAVPNDTAFVSTTESPAAMATFQAAIEEAEYQKNGCKSLLFSQKAALHFQLHFGCGSGSLCPEQRLREHLVLKYPSVSVRVLFLKCSLCIIHRQYYFCLGTSGIIPQRLKIIIPLTFMPKKN